MTRGMPAMSVFKKLLQYCYVLKGGLVLFIYPMLILVVLIFKRWRACFYRIGERFVNIIVCFCLVVHKKVWVG